MPSLSQIPADDRPRERLLRLGAGALSDAELVGILLGSGSQGENAVSLGQRLLSSAGGVGGLASAFPEELTRSRGVGPAGTARIAAAFELASRAGGPRTGIVLRSGSTVAEAAAPVLARERRERVVVLVADAADRLRRIVSVASGGVDAAPLPVREVLHAALRYDGRALALAHNHPSGDPTPSRADHLATDAVRRAAEIAGLRFLAHVVVAGTRWAEVT